MLEYVASGCNYLDINSSFMKSDERCIDDFRQMIGHCIHGQHKMSFLFNAHTEKSIGRVLDKFYRDHAHSIYSDSGGLQILTQGLSIDESMKTDIYRIQGEYSDFGMCFDEIPVVWDGERSDRNAKQGRYYDPDSLDDKAIQTGKNLNSQIDSYRKRESPCNAMLIAQGNCLESYQRWYELAMKQVSADNVPGVGGVAMGAAALGTGRREDIKRAFYFSQLAQDYQAEHLHILGVGSMYRLIPYLIFMQNGVFDSNLRISYDSTKHTAFQSFGYYYLNNGLMTLDKNQRNPKYKIIHDDLVSQYGADFVEMDLAEFVDAFLGTCVSYRERGLNPRNVLKARHLHIFGAIRNFQRHIDGCLNSIETMMSTLKKGELPHYRALYEVKSVDDFRHWEREHGYKVKSNGYKEREDHSLEAFFA